jgi:hypothetical protein
MQVDISEGIPKNLSVHFCVKCERCVVSCIYAHALPVVLSGYSKVLCCERRARRRAPRTHHAESRLACSANLERGPRAVQGRPAMPCWVRGAGSAVGLYIVYRCYSAIQVSPAAEALDRRAFRVEGAPSVMHKARQGGLASATSAPGPGSPPPTSAPGPARPWPHLQPDWPLHRHWTLPGHDRLC